jgi:hypothetical protein
MVICFFTRKEIKEQALKRLQVSAQSLRLDVRRAENKFSEGNAERLLSALARKGV